VSPAATRRPPPRRPDHDAQPLDAILEDDAPVAPPIPWKSVSLVLALAAAGAAGMGGGLALLAGEDFWAGALFAAAACGLLGAAAGATRGRAAEGAWGALLLAGAAGVFAGLAAAVAAALLPDSRPRCPECGGVVTAGARRCRHCREPLPQGD
jgi:hypothetical protein